MKRIFMISEREFDTLVPDIDIMQRAALWEVWRDDLSAKMSQTQLITYANALLAYFGSKVHVTDVGWDKPGACFSWEVEIAS